jgi:hypothetical protein
MSGQSRCEGVIEDGMTRESILAVFFPLNIHHHRRVKENQYTLSDYQPHFPPGRNYDCVHYVLGDIALLTH